VVVGHLLAHRLVEQLLELGQVTGPGHWKNTFHHSIVLFHRHPAVTDEEEPVNIKIHDHIIIPISNINPLTPTVAIWEQLIKYPVPGTVKPSFIIFDVRAL